MISWSAFLHRNRWACQAMLCKLRWETHGVGLSEACRVEELCCSGDSRRGLPSSHSLPRVDLCGILAGALLGSCRSGIGRKWKGRKISLFRVLLDLNLSSCLAVGLNWGLPYSGHLPVCFEGALCIVGCWAAWPLDTSSPPHHPFWQPKISPDIVQCSLGGKIISRWEPPTWMGLSVLQ